MKLLLSAVCILSSILPSTADTLPSVKVSPQSVECHYTEQNLPEGMTPVRCTVRLHATPSKGAALWTQGEHPIANIEATDANGNKMVGKFRDWEICFDSKDNCQILVFDFEQLPQGGALIFDTQIELPVTHGVQKHEAPDFSTKQVTEFDVAGHHVIVEPLEKSSAAPDELVLRISYNDATNVPEIIVCDDEGYHLKSNIIDADYDPQTGRTTAVYVQKYTKKSGKIALRTYKPCVNVKSDVKFKATIGRKLDTEE